MQDIPRNELIDKLAAGWKCRRKSWSLQSYRLVLADSEFISPQALVANDWEGEPPNPTRMSDCENLIYAIKVLKNKNAKFIRRTGWNTGAIIDCETNEVVLEFEDVIANDWEVWG